MCTVFQIIHVLNKLYIQPGCFQLFIYDIGFIDMHVLWKLEIIKVSSFASFGQTVEKFKIMCSHLRRLLLVDHPDVDHGGEEGEEDEGGHPEAQERVQPVPGAAAGGGRLGGHPGPLAVVLHGLLHRLVDEAARFRHLLLARVDWGAFWPKKELELLVQSWNS